MVATTEVNGRYYRTIDSGTHALDRFEFIHKVVDLRSQLRKDKEAKFYTKDNFEVIAAIGATYRVFSDHEASPQRPYPFNVDTVRTLAYTETNLGKGKVGGWEAMPLGQVKGALGKILSKLTLNDLLTLTEQDREPYLTIRVEHQARKALQEKGIDLIRAQISGIKLPEKVTEQHLKLWQADWESQAYITIASGKAEALEVMEIARAEAELTMVQAIIEGMNRAQSEGYTGTLNEVVAMRLIEAMEKLAHQTENDDTLPETLIPQLGDIQRGLLQEGQPTPDPTPG
jgi:regulator of protease activity HflC (stomatin/prohibitin superfamily)